MPDGNAQSVWATLYWPNLVPDPDQLGEFMVSTVDGKARIYQGGISVILEMQSNKGIADGYASLDNTGKVPAAQIPGAGVVTVASVVHHNAPYTMVAADGVDGVYVSIDTAGAVGLFVPPSRRYYISALVDGVILDGIGKKILVNGAPGVDTFTLAAGASRMLVYDTTAPGTWRIW